MVKPVYNLPDKASDDRIAASHWLASLPSDYPAQESARIREACEILIRCQGDRRLETGETQVRHLLATADILVQLRMDADTLIAALFNGCLSQGAMTEEGLRDQFGPTVATMVGDLQRIDQIANVNVVIAAKDLDQHEENLRRLLLGIAEDVRVVLIVLAERLHLMRSIKELPDAARQRKLARDTQRIYAPLANRLGIWQLKWELEDLALRYLEPQEYKRIANLLGSRRAEREAYIASVIRLLQERFAETSIRAQITGRPKHIYSIWKKMQRKGVDIGQIFDLRAVRILVDSIADCYAALGIVHGLWKHIPKEFDDYIATPKGNHYQSLHTAVIGPEDQALEVQIRTWAMHQHAELGVAAHWAYKENQGHDSEFQRRITWMRNWLELRSDGDEDEDLVAQLRAELEPAHVYVLTPKSKVIELPRGATVLDFAFAIHSEIGIHCRGARVDGKMVPLDRTLRSGQTVEILTQTRARPSRDWLDHRYLTTAKARNRVRQWFKKQQVADAVEKGQIRWHRECERLGVPDSVNLAPVLRKQGVQREEDLFAAIGRGELNPGPIVQQLAESNAQAGTRRVKRRRTRKPPPENSQPQVMVEGIGDLMVHMAQCCKPVPPEPIVGYITRGRGVTVHRQTCANIARLTQTERARLTDVGWSAVSVHSQYAMDLSIRARDRGELLSELIAVLTQEAIRLSAIRSLPVASHPDQVQVRLTVAVSGLDQAGRMMEKLRQIPDVFSVRRQG